MNPTGNEICRTQNVRSCGAVPNFHAHVRCVMIKIGEMYIKRKGNCDVYKIKFYSVISFIIQSPKEHLELTHSCTRINDL
jgi:hypothetical protein